MVWFAAAWLCSVTTLPVRQGNGVNESRGSIGSRIERANGNEITIGGGFDRNPFFQFLTGEPITSKGDDPIRHDR